MTIEEEDKLYIIWDLANNRRHGLTWYPMERDASRAAARLNSADYVETLPGNYVVMTVEESRGIVH